MTDPFPSIFVAFDFLKYDGLREGMSNHFIFIQIYIADSKQSNFYCWFSDNLKVLKCIISILKIEKYKFLDNVD